MKYTLETPKQIIEMDIRKKDCKSSMGELELDTKRDRKSRFK